MTRRRSDSRRRSDHVLYEIEMFCALAAYFESGAVDEAVRDLENEGMVVRNAAVEAFQLHARQLIDLFTGSDSRDMRASEFTRKPWQLKRTSKRQIDFDRFSQRVMHLSLKRATFTGPERRVASRRIRRDLGADIERFLRVVDEGKVCDGFVARARAALAESEPPDPAAHAVVGATELPDIVRTSVIQYSGGTATEALTSWEIP